MLNWYWTEKVGSGVIDCHIDPGSSTISYADVSGRFGLLNFSGVHIESWQHPTPIWGICHELRRDAQFLIVGAAADKSSNSGELVVSRDLQAPYVQGTTDGPAWDCLILGNDILVTDWSGAVSMYSVANDVERVQYQAQGSFYGLARGGGTTGLVTIAGSGVARLELGASDPIALGYQDARAAYNVDAVRNDAETLRVACGSTEGVCLVWAPGLRVLRMPGMQVSAVKWLSPELLLVGDLDGNLAVFSPLQSDEPWMKTNLGGQIWHIEFEADLGLGLIALGNGQLRAFEVAQDTTTLRTDGSQPSPPMTLPLAWRVIKDAKDSVDVEMSGEEVELAVSIEDIGEIFRNTGLLILGQYKLSRGDPQGAIELFQSIQPGTREQDDAVVPLADAFAAIGYTGTAIRILRTALGDKLSHKDLDTLRRLAQLAEARRDYRLALESYELAAQLDYAHPGIREGLERCLSQQAVPERASSELAARLSDTALSATVQGRRREDYSLIHYIHYEYPSAADDAKKNLEIALIEGTVRDVERAVAHPAVLDIGCATGRWPIHLARRGFRAEGYDISGASIGICRSLAEANPELDLVFTEHNIVDGPLKESYFDLVTCMMGTLNHVPRRSLPLFFRGVAASLAPQGRFVFSIWNTTSPFCDFLQLDGQAAKENLRRNGVEAALLLELLQQSGLRVDHQIPFCLLPNTVYDVLEDEFATIENIVDLDDYLRSRLAGERSQMTMIIGTKSEAM